MVSKIRIYNQRKGWVREVVKLAFFWNFHKLILLLWTFNDKIHEFGLRKLNNKKKKISGIDSYKQEPAGGFLKVNNM